MTIHTAFQSVYKSLVGISLVVILVACGGGGSSGPKAPTPDSSPDTFTIAAVTNAAVKTDVASSAVTVSGINQATAISIAGGTYSIGGAAYTDAAGTVTNGQTVTVKVTSSDKTNTAVTATLTIGGVSGQFKVTTLLDVTPDTFTFTAVKDVAPKSVNTASPVVTVAGIDIAVPISITNGEYSINDGTYTSTAGTVSNGQKVTVRATASDKVSTDVIAVLTIGGVTANYKVTTYADTAAPTAQILFPPPVSMTEGNTILVRGSANDDSAIVSVKVNSVLATTTDGYKNWQALVPLLLTGIENDLYVITEDAAGNKSTNAAHVAIRQAPLASAFPDGNNNFISIYGGLVIDKLDGRNRLLVLDPGNKIISVDLSTGVRSLFADVAALGLDHLIDLVIEPISKKLYSLDYDKENLLSFDLANGSLQSPKYYFDFDGNNSIGSIFSSPWDLALDDSGATSKIVSVNNNFEGGGGVIAFDPSSKAFNVVSDDNRNIPNASNPLYAAQSIVLDKAHARYLVSVGDQDADASKHGIYSVDTTTGMRSILSSNNAGAGEAFTSDFESFIAGLRGIAIDVNRNRVLVCETFTGKIFAIDLTSGDRTVIANLTYLSVSPRKAQPDQIVIDNSNNYAFVLDTQRKAIYVVDLLSGEKVILSKSANTF